MNDLARWLLNLPPQASSLARRIDYLHYFVIGISIVGATVVFGAILGFTIRYHTSRRPSVTPRVTGNIRIEAGVIVSILGLFIGIWIVGFHDYIQLETPPKDCVEVYVTAKQWMWKFAYATGQASAGVLFVPEDRPVKLIMTSRDVIHSFFVPAFRVKQDVVPGRYTLAWFKAVELGTFPIRCAEYCGVGHSRMLGDVVVLPPQKFEEWLRNPEGPIAAELPTPPNGVRPTFDQAQRSTLAQEGERVAADKGCLRCHSLDGTKFLAPTWAGLWGSEVTMQDGSVVRAGAAYLTQSMMDPKAKVVKGFTPIMPSYRGQLTPPEVGAIIELIKSLSLRSKRVAHPNPPPVQPGGLE